MKNRIPAEVKRENERENGCKHIKLRLKKEIKKKKTVGYEFIHTMIIAKLENEERSLEHLISIHLHKKYIGLAYLVLLFILLAPNDKKNFQIKPPNL